MRIEVTAAQARHLARLVEIDLLVYGACLAEVRAPMFRVRVMLNQRLLGKLTPKKRKKNRLLRRPRA